MNAGCQSDTKSTDLKHLLQLHSLCQPRGASNSIEGKHMSFYFFLSHARIDRDNDSAHVLVKLYEDLDREICRKENIREGVAGFFDRTGIQQGTNWAHELNEALRTCRVLLCVYSKAYFDSDYCGREWAIF